MTTRTSWWSVALPLGTTVRWIFTSGEDGGVPGADHDVATARSPASRSIVSVATWRWVNARA